MPKTSKEALAIYFAMDATELGEYVYQRGRYTRPVYVVGYLESLYVLAKGYRI